MYDEAMNAALNKGHNCPKCNTPMESRSFHSEDLEDFCDDPVLLPDGLIKQTGQHGVNYKKLFMCPECHESKINNHYVKNSASGGTGGCYVATCVYGSYDCPEVWTLRRYRDNVLAGTWLGRKFISAYYATSPKLVKLFGHRQWFHKICKPCVDKLVYKIRKKGI